MTSTPKINTGKFSAYKKPTIAHGTISREASNKSLSEVDQGNQ
ncbi:MAG: hypothetical protein ACFCBU_12180 [Cyanophyceae cyanobacterium]